MTTLRSGHTPDQRQGVDSRRICGHLRGRAQEPWAPIDRNAEIYDPDGEFLPTGDMTAPCHYHTATLLPDGRVLFAGGYITAGTGVIPSNSVEIPSTGTFAATRNEIGYHTCHEAHLLASGKALIAGRFDPNVVTCSELYDPATGTFAATGGYAKATFN